MATENKPRDLHGSDIVVSHFTLGRHHDITSRLDAVADAGCQATGLYIGDYLRMEADGTADLLVEMLDQRELCLAEIDALRGWGDPSTATSAEAFEQEEAAYRMADRFECRSLHVLAPGSADTVELAEAFGALCDRAGEHGLLVALEFMPTTAVSSAEGAMRVVEGAGRDNGGICVDLWHHQRSSALVDSLATLPAELVIDVQISDGPLVPAVADYAEDTRRNRLPPGEGEMDLPGFISAIRSTATTAPWALEVCNEAAWDTDGSEFIARCADGLRRVLHE